MLGKPVPDFSLCFYPKDNTPGCTTVYGVSRDSLKSHDSFKACTPFGVIKDKNPYGKKVRGIERSTFVIDEKGKLACEWRG